jgi:hypothetical protein
MTYSHTSIYPLSADDVGCTIKVEAEAIEDGYSGTAYAEFGPVTIEPATKKSLEYILGTGSSEFPVTIFYMEDRNKLPEDRDGDEGLLIICADTVNWRIIVPYEKLQLVRKYPNLQRKFKKKLTQAL